MSLADMIGSDVVTETPPVDRVRESWRQVMSMKRSTQQFRARLAKAQTAVENEIELDPQFGDVTVTIATVVRILDWTLRDLDRLRLPDELFEVVRPRPVIRIAAQGSARPSVDR
jgi:hypothetical protein